MEPKSLLPSLQEPTPRSYPKPDQFTPRLSFLFSKIHFNIIISVLRYSEWYISFRFPTKPTVLKKNSNLQTRSPVIKFALLTLKIIAF